jgi:4-hydroxyphenylacetate 3-monooxygenase, oxygenase component
MGARNGRRFLEEMDNKRREVWYGNEKITYNITKHPAFKGISQTLAKLYDLQYDPDLIDIMTYVSPTSGERVGMSFLQPKTKEDLEKRTRMIKIWADYSFGLLGRTPDYLNSALMAMASAAEFFGKGKIDFAENVRKYYEYVRENDLCLTHTLINPQVNRSVTSPSKLPDPYIAARVVEKTSEGVVIRGARMLATLPLADEILVFPSTVLKSGQDDAPYAMAFALSVDTPGLKFICRESFAHNSTFDHPLSSRFDEQDAVVVFDDVLVPWERIFILEEPEKCNIYAEATGAVIFMAHQALVREISKCEFVVGLATLIAETIGIDQYLHIQEKIAELIMLTESMRAFLIASEANAKLNKWGILMPDPTFLHAARNLWPRVAHKLNLVIRQLGASGLMAIPPFEVMNSEIKQYVDKYYQAKLANAEERIKLFKLAWDFIGTSFGSRQDLYEYFFFGDPVRMASNFYNWYTKKDEFKNRVKDFLSEIK